jgi:hypothetical protein
MLRLMPSCATGSLPINLAFLLGDQAHQGFLFWAVFALFKSILRCCGGRYRDQVLALTEIRVRSYS